MKKAIWYTQLTFPCESEPQSIDLLTGFPVWFVAIWARVLPWGTKDKKEIVFFFFKFFNVYLFLRERQITSGRGTERWRHRIWSGLQILRCQHRAWCRARTHEPGDHDLSRSRTFNQLSHTGALKYVFLFFCFFLREDLCFTDTAQVY